MRKKLSPTNIAIFAGPSPATGVHTTSNIHEIYGVQSFNFDLTDEREDVFIFGQRASEGRFSTSAASATFDLSYYLSNFDNEKSIGFSLNGSGGAFTNLLDGTKDERNFFVMIASDGNDAIGSPPSSTPCLGFGNATLNAYNFSAAVGGYPTCSLSFEAIDAEYYEDSDSQRLPAINTLTDTIAAGTFTLPTASGNSLSGRDPILRPRDITVNLSGASGLFHDLSSACVQSVDLSIEFGREAQECLGSRYRKDSVIADNVPMTLAVEFLAKDMTTGRLSTFTCETGKYRAIISINRPSCNGNGDNAITYDLKGLSWESQSQDFTLGQQSTVTINFQGTIGGANDLENGLFASGITNIPDDWIVVADEEARLSLTGINYGQLVYQTDDSNFYRFSAPSSDEVAVFVNTADGAAGRGIYTNRGSINGKPYFNLIGFSNSVTDYAIYWDGSRWNISVESVAVAISYDEVDNPWEATWKNEEGSMGAIAIVVAQGELDAGITISGAGNSGADGILVNINTPMNGFPVWNKVATGDNTVLSHDAGGTYYYYDEFTVSYQYMTTDNVAFPWSSNNWDVYVGSPPAPTIVRNDIASPSNWTQI